MPGAYPSRGMTQGDTTVAGLSDGMCCIEGGPACPVGSWAPGSKSTGERADPRPRNVTGAAARVTQAVTAVSTTSQSVTKRPAPSLEIRASTHPSQGRGRWAVTSRDNQTRHKSQWGQETDSPSPTPCLFLPPFLSLRFSLSSYSRISFFLMAPSRFHPSLHFQISIFSASLTINAGSEVRQ